MSLRDDRIIQLSRTGVQKRVQRISGDPGTLYPQFMDAHNMQPVYDFSNQLEESYIICKNIPGAYVAAPSDILNDATLISRLNSAKALRFNGASIQIQASGTAQWNVHMYLFLRVNDQGGNQQTILLADEYQEIGVNDTVPVVFENQMSGFTLDRNQGWDADNNVEVIRSLERIDLESFRQYGTGTGRILSYTYSFSLLY